MRVELTTSGHSFYGPRSTAELHTLPSVVPAPRHARRQLWEARTREELTSLTR